ncbi:hypothetical protein [Methyloradius palustris]|uniref:Uncharacterized protein n=1 Tax=Methyloradius palustris TaxID=2778876 RepID=A0A8D5K0U9_9PROT|nr:hypothetical protein [Methyloradius palustris]BCM25108.1 hypothetical protein ZMTM_13670 [Methyloradius palustris]
MKTKIIEETTEDFFASGRAIAQALDKGESINESRIVSYEPDDGPLTSADIKWIREQATPFLPKGKLLKKTTLF